MQGLRMFRPLRLFGGTTTVQAINSDIGFCGAIAARSLLLLLELGSRSLEREIAFFAQPSQKPDLAKDPLPGVCVHSASEETSEVIVVDATW